MNQQPAWIGGKAVTTDQSIDIENPFSGELVGQVPLCGEREVEAACQAALEVLERDDLRQYQRAQILDRAAVLLSEQKEDFAQLITAESGKTISGARGEVGRCIDTLSFAAATARHLKGEMIASDASVAGQGKLTMALRVPVGVIAAITPFNFPLNLVAHKIAPALAAGCPVVLKPAPQTPLTALKFIALLREAGMPADWVSVLTDRGAEAAAPLVAHEIPRLITFTGSCTVGWMIAAQAPKKKVSLELGSNSPLIIEPDADLKAIAAKVRVAGFANGGQSCIAVQRILVHESVEAVFREELLQAIDRIVVGDPTNDSTEVGPLIRSSENLRVSEWLEEAVEAGGTVIKGGTAKDGVFQPTVVDNVPRDCKLWTDEIFGPVVAMRSYSTLDEAIALANEGTLKLHVGLFTQDIDKALGALRKLDFGGVLINEVPTSRLDQQPYGGILDGGNTREGPEYAVEEMTELKYVSFQAGRP
ncbi:MAG: aldehyde dehydrogenase [Myxococcales bacterium]|nr:aldehyde dehydrogenase [Myxococcales bacterium]